MFESNIARRILTMAGGAAGAQAIWVLAAPLLTRLYSPADYGLSAIFFGTMGVLAVMATWRLEFAIPVQAEVSEARRVAQAGLVLAAICAVVVLFAGWIVGGWICSKLKAPDLVNYLWLLPIAIFGTSAYNLGNYLVLREQNYSYIARTRLWQAIYGVITSVLLGVFHSGALGLLVGNTIGQSAGAFRLLRGTLSEALFKRQRILMLLSVAWSYNRFAMKLTSAGLLNTGSLFLVPALFSGFYGLEAAGSLAMALRLMTLPLTYVGSAVGQVFVGEASMVLQKNPEAFSALVMSFIRRLLPVAALTGLLGLVMPWLTPYVFGVAWREAGILAAILAPMCAVQLLISPLGMISVVVKRPGAQVVLDVVRMVAVAASLLGAGIGGLSARYAVAIYSAGVVLSYIIIGVVLARLVRQQAVTPLNGDI